MQIKAVALGWVAHGNYEYTWVRFKHTLKNISLSPMGTDSFGSKSNVVNRHLPI